ncbi:GGDEF domain-containing protein [Labrys wisconsinensis]|uniref:diguanylate cyclase n=1 Tax=Labrys wisconsinensis TaxID=425677 RepID=A0ABU0JAF8_9HYPH|nr:GGDEF domain-containing protein [Labrys wisconsinensis]MDQ0470264.1 diguanylate cyclase (GGDEF)-like protein [Labrys wisconsinensis]
MSFDPATLMTLTAMVAAAVGSLLVFAWVQNPSHRALGIWGGADLAGALAAVLLMTRNDAPDLVSIVLAHAVLAAAYGAIWAGGRSFCRRPLRPLAMAAGPAVWLAACAWPPFLQSTDLRVILASLIGAAYAAATARELRRDDGEPLLSRRPAAACFALHAGLLLARGGVAMVWTLPPGSQVLATPWLVVMAVEPLILVVATGFLQLAMAKERSELVQRRAAATDALTGVANRRAFLEEGERRLEAAARQGAPAALLLFDLDHFKRINDGHGHDAGDRALQAFAGHTALTLPADTLFGRIGGEEFAALLTGPAARAALPTADRIRRVIESMALAGPGMPAGLSVSIGVSTAADADLGALLRQADRALYAAKSAGRNCVRAFRPRSAPFLRVV